jgi:hypothetical protein
MSIIGTLRQSPRRTILVANELRADIVRDGREMARSRMTQCMVRPCVASGFRRTGGERSCINVSGL